MNLPVYSHMSTYEKYFGEKNIKKWEVFFNYFNDNKLDILDFGCGAGWSLHLGKNLDYNIFGLDIKGWCNFNEFNNFRIALGIAKYTALYSGVGILPFLDKSFSLIVCRGSFHQHYNTEGLRKKDKNKIILERINEFSRILKGPRILVIAGGFFLGYKNEFLKANLKNCYIWNRNKIKPIWR